MDPHQTNSRRNPTRSTQSQNHIVQVQMYQLQADDSQIGSQSYELQIVQVSQDDSGATTHPVEVVFEDTSVPITCANNCLVCLTPINRASIPVEQGIDTRSFVDTLMKSMKLSLAENILDMEGFPGSFLCDKCYSVVSETRNLTQKIRQMEQDLRNYESMLKDEVRRSNFESNYVDLGFDSANKLRQALVQQLTGRKSIQEFTSPENEIIVSVSKRGRPRKLKNVIGLVKRSRQKRKLPAVLELEHEQQQVQLHETTTDNFHMVHEDLETQEFEDISALEADSSSNPEQATVGSALRRSLRQLAPKLDNMDKVSWVCELCRQEFDTHEDLETHALDHAEEDFRCQLCDKTFDTAKRLQLHQTMGHKQGGSQVIRKKPKGLDREGEYFYGANKKLESFLCAHCDNNLHRKDFNEIENGTVRFPCSEPGCSKTYPKFGMLVRHHEKTCRSKPKNELVCKICSKEFYSLKTLQCHMASFHTKEYNFYCEQCGAGVPNRWALNRHMLGHTGERKHTCHICNQSFKRKDYLILHMRRHNNDMPYMCGQCGKRFINKQELKLHEERHDNVKKFPCHLCNKLFSSKPYVANHIWATHNKGRTASKAKGRKYSRGLTTLIEDKLLEVPEGNYRLARVRTDAQIINLDVDVAEVTAMDYDHPEVETTPEVTTTVTIGLDEVSQGYQNVQEHM